MAHCESVEEKSKVDLHLTGAEDYMVKPFVSRELVARVSLQVQLGKRRRILEKAFAQRLDEVERRRQEAEQERKRQELLIDVTSCVDGISGRTVYQN